MAADRRVTFVINGSTIASPPSPSSSPSPPPPPSNEEGLLSTGPVEPGARVDPPRRPRPVRNKEPSCWRAVPPITGYRRIIIDILNGLVFLFSIIMFYAAMGSLAHMDVEDLKIDPFMYLAVLASLVSLFVSVLGCQTPRRRKPLRLTLYITFMVATTVCFLASAIEISQFRAVVQDIADHDVNYYDHHTDAAAHDYLDRYQQGFMSLWELGECVGGGCRTSNCSEEPLEFQSVSCPMDTNLQKYLEGLFVTADEELTDELVLECRQWLIAQGQEPIRPPDADPVADPYGNVNSWCRVRNTVAESPLGSITACIWLAGLLAILQVLALTAVVVVELTDRMRLVDLLNKGARQVRLRVNKQTQEAAELV
ncbi:hypothetical protein FOZ61_003726 [Perkinsus olseni]|uniref:Uncharacterized protein n=1 Tax=Perkinsus olseni TaxID=32597 RepID=A0A7J6LP75_PEROL|nr:hypothetical protein FOZ61_003726 [Perkinsus olseni]KAF4661642.1 hypothetical protein FOL46_005654 [Perkinsus olseni]